ncbi:poly-beta-1,6-N-acetyl-D-glucosamine N-deacetylase PgaB [Halomonas sp. MCCC 1A11058]|uniref:Poly-beta-1,6-N-acetyl-D-glucosamine N-deacetylase PgaB n=2 Tax=Billgrantia aerodenitrificans TaxID=2733483 RepID=A0ABS9AQV6_9GAMM|nr:poly-beta-1,6-N-acetyl-D-glucosamine N-deacetylase PgaB [Halomonas aerodenitrificans]
MEIPMSVRMALLFGLLYLCILAQPALAAREGNDFVVISYHDVVDFDVTPKLALLPQTITRTRLIEHFNLIRAHGYQPVSLQQVLDAEAGIAPLPDKAVMLVFDDGYRSFYDIVYPLLQLYRYPAITAIVGSWIDVPPTDPVPYGDGFLERDRIMTREQLRELHDDPLVEIASHTYDLHYGVIGNPQGNEQAAAVTSRWQTDGYESEADYLQRIRDDMHRASEQLKEITGTPPRLMVWPYGAYSQATLDIAAEHGMPHSFSLLSQPNRIGDGTRVMGRYLIDQETSLQTFEEILSNRVWERDVLRIVHVDLDYVYDPDPIQQEANLDLLIDRIYRFGVSTVYLQAFADPNGNGVAEALYFPNRHLPMREDLFNRVAWQLKKRADVKVYAWMPVLAFDLGPGHPYVTDARTGQKATEHYLRLSPYSAANRQLIAEIYEDLGRMTKFDGLLFHDDAFLTDFEDASEEARSVYADEWNLPPDVDSIRADEALFHQWTQQKTSFLTQFTLELVEAANYYRQSDNKTFTISRNIYALPILEPESQAWFAQSAEDFAAAYDYVAVMAMPYMEEADNPQRWLEELARASLAAVPADRLVFELQTRDWRDDTLVPNEVLMSWIDTVKQTGVRHIGYYPDDFHINHPDIYMLRPIFSLGRRFGVQQ